VRVLALEPYYGGSHRAFLDGWAARSRHDFTVLGLPPHKWKWRMRHAAITLAERTAKLVDAGASFDIVWASDMLNLAEFRGLAPESVARLPSVFYFHENQLTYGEAPPSERDHHFAFTNFISALAARAVWFNSEFHRNELLAAWRDLFERMPDHRPLAELNAVERKASVESPGIEGFPRRGERRPGPLRILHCARWEHDKGPEVFFGAIEQLAAAGDDFRLLVAGESFDERPEIFEQARRQFHDRIEHWGYAADRGTFRQLLLDADVVVSTARHEFFGIAVLEAIAAGAFPLLPNRLSYPELLNLPGNPAAADHLYDGSVSELTDRLQQLCGRLARGELWRGDPAWARRATARYQWTERAPALDAALDAAHGGDH